MFKRLMQLDIILLVLSSCSVDAPSLGSYYKCEGDFTCDDRSYHVKSEGCADDEESAVSLTEADVVEQLNGACEIGTFDVQCHVTSRVCVH